MWPPRLRFNGVSLALTLEATVRLHMTILTLLTWKFTEEGREFPLLCSAEIIVKRSSFFKIWERAPLKCHTWVRRADL